MLIISQKIDKMDPILGFFHNWLLQIAPHFENISVICLERGEYALPSNVKVYSLGKENAKSKIKYIYNFYKLLFQLNQGYDRVFVHMNQEYALLAGLYWWLKSKKVYFWRNHPKGGLLTRIAVSFSHKVFCTSKDAYTAKFYKTKLMPVGIDTDLFNISDSHFASSKNIDASRDKSNYRIPNSILSLGRLSPIKNIHVLIGALKLLAQRNTNFIADIIGNPVNPEDTQYVQKLESDAQSLIQGGLLSFLPSVNQEGAATAYKTHKVFVNLTPRGSMDKTVLEAAACGCVPLVRNGVFDEINKDLQIDSEGIEEIALKLQNLLDLPEESIQKLGNELRNFVVEKHSLRALIDVLVKELND